MKHTPWPGPGAIKAIESDNIWFQRHPNRSGRIRPYIDGEAGRKVCTFVERLPSGALERRVLTLPAHIDLRELNTERGIKNISQHLFVCVDVLGNPNEFAPEIDLAHLFAMAGAKS